MKLLIVYDSGNGTVRTCAERLQRELPHFEVDLVSLRESTPDPAQYDVVVAGSSVRFGKLRRAMRRFLTENLHTLCKKPLALFFCCGLTEEQEYYTGKIFPAELSAHAIHIAFFGGSLNTEGLSRLDRFFVRSIRSQLFEKEMDDGNYVPNLPYLLPENVSDLANRLTALGNRLREEQKSQ